MTKEMLSGTSYTDCNSVHKTQVAWYLVNAHHGSNGGIPKLRFLLVRFEMGKL